MVALAEKYTRESYTPRNRTAENSRSPQNAYPDFFLQPKNRGPATNNRILSSKYLDDTTEWYYYGYRYYNPELGRWPSRDPIGERGGLSLYTFVVNSPVDATDVLGLSTATGPADGGVQLYGSVTVDASISASLGWGRSFDVPYVVVVAYWNQEEGCGIGRIAAAFVPELAPTDRDLLAGFDSDDLWFVRGHRATSGFRTIVGDVACLRLQAAGQLLARVQAFG